MHYMIDIETMATSCDAAIVSIAAVPFYRDGETGVYIVSDHRPFYGVIPVATALNSGRFVDGQTVAWWLGQSNEARNALLHPSGEHIYAGLSDLLMGLRRYIVNNEDTLQTDAICVWGNGATFDISILDHAYSTLERGSPWPFRGVRDMRTLKWIIEERGALESTRLETNIGVAHNALDDAKWQAEQVVFWLNYLMDT